MAEIGDALQALVLTTLRARVDAGDVVSPEDVLALLELAEAQRSAIADLRRALASHDLLALSHGQLAAEWLELSGLLAQIGLRVGQDSDRRAFPRRSGGWYWQVGEQRGGGYADVIAAYRAGFPVLLAEIIARQEVPNCSAVAE